MAREANEHNLDNAATTRHTDSPLVPTPAPSVEVKGLGIENIVRVGPYRLGKTLGRGAFAVVRAARHLPTDELVAIKLFDKTLIQDEYLLRTLHREPKFLRKLHHPNVIQLLEVMETSKVLCLVLEHAKCDVLTSLCKNGVHNETQARKYARQLIAAVRYFHSCGIVHRDLKAENLMLDEFDNLKIIDFGLGNNIREGELLETHCGSMAYSAPELIGKKPYGKPVDVWSLGVCLYVMLTGHLPFPADRLTELHAAMLEGDIKLPDKFSGPLKDLFDRIFQVKPQRRITMDELVEHEWVVHEGVELPLPLKPLQLADVNVPIVSQMVRMGFDEPDTINAILRKKCDSAHATYHLMYFKKLRLERRQTKLDQAEQTSSGLRRGSSSSSLKKKSEESSGHERRGSIGRRPGSRRERKGSDESLGVPTAPTGRRGSIGAESRRKSNESSSFRRASVTSLEPRPRRTSAESPCPSRRGSAHDRHASDRPRRGSIILKLGSSPTSSTLDDRRNSGDSLERQLSDDIPTPRSPVPPSRRNSRGKKSIKRSTSEPVLAKMIPPTAHFEVSYEQILSELAHRCQHDEYTGVLIGKVVGLSHKGLRLAPDISLYKTLEKFGWDGTTFGMSLELEESVRQLGSAIDQLLSDHNMTSPLTPVEPIDEGQVTFSRHNSSLPQDIPETSPIDIPRPRSKSSSRRRSRILDEDGGLAMEDMLLSSSRKSFSTLDTLPAIKTDHPRSVSPEKSDLFLVPRRGSTSRPGSRPSSSRSSDGRRSESRHNSRPTSPFRRVSGTLAPPTRLPPDTLKNSLNH
eukprot:m.121289 g.121289  ORF g.121289 m.121289 type:complete len:802 (-) comp23273_c0_seq1:26-2431(-)